MTEGLFIALKRVELYRKSAFHVFAVVAHVVSQQSGKMGPPQQKVSHGDQPPARVLEGAAMNGQERAQANYLAFAAWVCSRTDADLRETVAQGRLNRGEICRECGFGRSVLVQNPRVKEALQELEGRLRSCGVLPPLAPMSGVPLRAKGQLQMATDAERLKKLEAENAGLRAELSELRQRFKRFESLEAVLAETGRLAR